MLSFPIELAQELTEDDVLRIDPVKEYDRRLVWRQCADRLFSEVGDGTDEVLERGRPTGP